MIQIRMIYEDNGSGEREEMHNRAERSFALPRGIQDPLDDVFFIRFID